MSSGLPWSVVAKVLGDRPPPGSCWIPQGESGPEFFGALESLPKKSIEIYQSFRPEVLRLQAAGFRVSQELPAKRHGWSLFVPTRQRVESLGLLAHALEHLEPEGRLLFVCANDQGAGGFLSRIKELAPGVEADSAKKCRWAWISPGDVERPELLAEWRREAGPTKIEGGEFRSLPGIFGWNKIDRGSELLLTTLPELAGVGADFGSGYGYLSHGAFSRSPGIEKLHLVEAEFRALESARLNLEPWKARCEFHWLDVTAKEGQKALRNLDWILMNPPFHQGRDLKHDVGRAFLESAALSLKPGGRLFLVANEFLGYEDILRERFRSSKRLLLQEGFKVIHAER